MSYDERLGLPSASGAGRWMLCAGSFLAEKGMPPEKERAATSRGTKIHEALEGKRNWNSLCKSDQIVGYQIAEMEASLIDRFNLHTVAAIKEKRLWLIDDEEKVFSAKPDAVFFSEQGHCLVINYKTGRYEVPHIKTNWQCHAEALCVLDNYPDVEKIAVGLIHPNTSRPKQVAGYSKSRLEALRKDMVEMAKLAMEKDAPRLPGAEQCQWCRFKEQCEDYKVWRQL